MIHIDDYDDYQIYRASRTESGRFQFYGHMGGYFADAAVRREIGGPLNDGDNRVWLLAFDGEPGPAEPVGFVAHRFSADGRTAWCCGAYVRPEHRRRGLYRFLFGRRLNILLAAGPDVIRVAASPLARPLFDLNGWTATRKKGAWTYMEKRVGSRPPTHGGGVP